MKIFLKIFFLVSLIFCSVNADEKLELKKEFINKLDLLVEVIKDKKNTQNEKYEKIIALLTPMFDFELMAKLSLGKKWYLLNDQEQKDFIKLYVNRMKKSYASKVDSYNDEKIEVTSIEAPKENRIVLYSNIVTDQKKIDIVYKFYKPKEPLKDKSKWLIYDAEILGISILKTDKSQFEEFLQTKTIQELMNSMK